MDRRRFLLTSLAGALAAPVAAGAQQAAKIARIGYLTVDNPSVTPHHSAAFRQELRDLGYVEGRNLAIEYRSVSGTAQAGRSWVRRVAALWQPSGQDERTETEKDMLKELEVTARALGVRLDARGIAGRAGCRSARRSRCRSVGR
jgi:hypothetical protein